MLLQHLLSIIPKPLLQPSAGIAEYEVPRSRVGSLTIDGLWVGEEW